MPRQKAPDPLIEEYAASNGRTYTLEAFKHGGLNVYFGEKLVAVRAAQVGAFFGAPRFATLAIQAQALQDAKARANGLRDEQH